MDWAYYCSTYEEPIECKVCGKIEYSPDDYCSEDCMLSDMTDSERIKYYKEKELKEKKWKEELEREKGILEAKNLKYDDIVTVNFEVTADQIRKKISSWDGNITAIKQIEHNGYSFIVESVLYFSEVPHMQEDDIIANVVVSAYGHDDPSSEVKVYYKVEIDREALFKCYADPSYFADLINNRFSKSWVFNSNFEEDKRSKQYADISITII